MLDLEPLPPDDVGGESLKGSVTQRRPLVTTSSARRLPLVFLTTGLLVTVAIALNLRDERNSLKRQLASPLGHSTLPSTPPAAVSTDSIDAEGFAALRTPDGKDSGSLSFFHLSGPSLNGVWLVANVHGLTPRTEFVVVLSGCASNAAVGYTPLANAIADANGNLNVIQPSMNLVTGSYWVRVQTVDGQPIVGFVGTLLDPGSRQIGRGPMRC